MPEENQPLILTAEPNIRWESPEASVFLLPAVTGPCSGYREAVPVHGLFSQRWDANTEKHRGRSPLG